MKSVSAVVLDTCWKPSNMPAADLGPSLKQIPRQRHVLYASVGQGITDPRTHTTLLGAQISAAMIEVRPHPIAFA